MRSKPDTVDQPERTVHYDSTVNIVNVIIIIFLRPLAQSRRLKIKQLWVDMALTQI